MKVDRLDAHDVCGYSIFLGVELSGVEFPHQLGFCLKFELNIDEDVFLSPTAISGVFGLPGVPSLALPDVLGAISTVGSPISSV